MAEADADDVAVELSIKKAKRKTLRTSITKDLKKIADQFDVITRDEALDAQVMLSKLQSYDEQIGECDAFILRNGTVAEDITKEVEVAFEYQMRLGDAISRLQAQLRSISVAANTDSGTGTAPKGKSTVKTPKLELTKFSGDPLRWQEFWDDFGCTIDSRADLSIIDKFKILKQSLLGEALSVTDGYFLTQNNYEEVKAALQDRFGDPQVAIHAHFMALMEMKPASHDVGQLVKMRDGCEAHIRSLVALGVSEDTFGVVFAPLVLSKLPKFVRMELNRLNGSNKWTLPRLRELLRDEISARTRSERGFAGQSSGDADEEGKGRSPNQGSRKHPKGTATTLMVQANQRAGSAGTRRKVKCCVFCDERHDSWVCSKYPTAEERLQLVKGRCFRCFSKDHRVANCPSRKTCYYCGKINHNSSLCYQKFGRPTPRDATQMCQTLNPDAPEFVSHSSNALRDDAQSKDRRGTAVMESATVKVKGGKASADALVVFDNCSTTTLIRKGLSRKIGAKPLGDNFTALSRVGERQGKRDKYPRVNLTLTLKDGSTLEVIAREIDCVAAPLHLVPLDLHGIEKHIGPNETAKLCVSQPTDAEIDILLGLNYYYLLMGQEVCRTANGLVVKTTRVGYILTGYATGLPGRDEGPGHQLLTIEQPPGVQDMPDMERLWRLEDIGITENPGLKDDDVAQTSFDESVRYEEGRYTVKFPFKTEVPEVPDNKSLALARLRSTYRKLEADPDLMKSYNQVFTDQLGKGVIEEAPEVPTGAVHYLPHHAVLTPGKTTTKVRVVFDASARATPKSTSLNDTMLRGPVLLNDMCGLILRFRLPAKAVSTDVEKAFLQIRLHETHRDCTRFFWLRDTGKPPIGENLVVLRYARVPFGMKSSPFLLAATIVHHLRTIDSPRAREIERNTYMDNVFCGCSSTEDALGCYREAKRLFDQISMNLREWYCNDVQFMTSIPEKDRGKSQEPSVLGIRWNPTEDTIRCSVGGKTPEIVTKRTILQYVASVFDPCGWFSAITINGKILMQQMWREKVSWDEVISSDETRQTWDMLVRDLAALSTFRIPRLYTEPISEASRLQLHVFCDASSRAFAACVYLRSNNPAKTTCDLVFAKARVAPLKELTIPKLELMAVVIGCRMVSFVEAELQRPIAATYVWTDSMCVIGWLKSDKVKSVFVENRLKKLRAKQHVKFRFVKTHENPADLPTRGKRTEDLRQCNLWWKGPSWLVENEESWPNREILSVQPDDEEVVSAVVETDNVEDPLFDAGRYSGLLKLLRVTCYVFAAVRKFKDPSTSAHEAVNAVALQKTMEFWEKRVQTLHYGTLINHLVKGDVENSKWKNFAGQLGTFMDPKGFLRCNGRFGQSPDLNLPQKCPKLLPPGDSFTCLLIGKFHVRALHAGPKHTLALLRSQYWIPRGRSCVRSVLQKCNVCRRWEGGQFRVPTVAPLPDFRVSVQRPFQTVGIDYMGPLHVRGSETAKAWIVLFTCAVSRAIHLEVVETVSAYEFLLVLRRFMAIYGCPAVIVSDNAAQFKLSDQVAQRLWRAAERNNEVQQFMVNKGIRWHYITEKAPWMGGFYERLVALVKQALKKTLGRWAATAKELAAIAYEVSNVLNTRPLVYSEDDPTEWAITPAHLLFKSADLFPDAELEYDPRDVTSRSDELLLHWKAGQALLRNFWQVWRDQYLLALREYWRPLRNRAASDIPPNKGAVVLIKEPLPRGMWKVGRICDLKTSIDGRVRTAQIKLPSGGIIQRPLRLLYPIEGSCEATDEEADHETGSDGSGSPGPAVMRPQRAAAASAASSIRRQLRDE